MVMMKEHNENQTIPPDILPAEDDATPARSRGSRLPAFPLV